MTKINLTSSFKNNLIIIFIVFFGLSTRLWGGSHLFFWNVDEDIVGLTVKRILVDYRPQLIGFPIPGGIYLGPLYYYLISIFYLLPAMNPERLYVFSALLGSAAIFLVYFVGTKIFESKRVGIFAAIFYAVSYLANVYGRVLSALSLAPILSLLTYLILYQNIKTRKPKYLIPLGVVLVVAVQNEGSSISLLILTVLTWIIYRLKLPRKQLLIVVLIIVVFHLPLLLFDLRHDFFLTKSLLAFFSKGDTTQNSISLDFIPKTLGIFPSTLARLIVPSGNFSVTDQILPCDDLTFLRISGIKVWSFIASIFVLGYFIISQIFLKKPILGSRIVLIHFLVLASGLLLFNLFLKGYLYEWILVVFFPGFCFIIAFTLDKLCRSTLGKVLVGFAMIIFLIVNLNALAKTRDKFGLSSKVAAVKETAGYVGNRQFALQTLGSCYSQGYIYLFWYFGHMPITSYADDSFTPTFYERLREPEPELSIVMVNPSNRESESFWSQYNLYKQAAKVTKRVDSIEVLIIEGKLPNK